MSDPLESLRQYIAKNGLKTSRQRELIAEIFFQAGGHLRVEDVLDQVRKKDDRVGQATVYRTMKLLAKAGLAEPHQFGDGHTRYEPVEKSDEHHDHLICTECGRIIEFLDPRIEALQIEVAKERNFIVTDHKMELYGLCSGMKDTGVCSLPVVNDGQNHAS